MKTVQRFEEAEILDFTENEEDGFLTVEIAATRTGVMPYYDWETDTLVNELKPPEEIFSETTMESLKGVPITDRHPPMMVNSENWLDFTKGTTHLDVRQEDNKLVVSETLFDDNLIAYVKSGKKAQVSIGFRAEIDESPGEFEGEEYDRVQRNIRINHVAHVKEGRAGEEIRARIDSKAPIRVGYSSKQEKEDEKTMDYEKVEHSLFDGKEFYVENDPTVYTDKLDEILAQAEQEVPEMPEMVEVEIGDEAIEVPVSAKEKIEELISEKETLEGKLDSKEDEVETLESRVDELEQKDIEAVVQDRLDLIHKVEKHIEGFDASGKSAEEIKVELIQKLDEDFDAEEKSDEYINARFDGAISTLNRIKNDSFGSNNLFTKKEKKDKKDKFKDKKNKRKNMKK